MAIDKVLAILAERQERQPLMQALGRKGIEPLITDSFATAKELILTQAFDLVICDVTLSGGTGLELLKFVKKQALTILLADFYTLSLALEGMRMGALTYLLKPFTPGALETVLEKAYEQAGLIQENLSLRQEISTSPHGSRNRIIAESAVMKRILGDVAKVATSSASVFLSGESGTGKEVIAEAIHAASLRKAQPFIKVNCAAIPESLIESEFFGHEKGAFTGALMRRIGRFELADRGTLLLDEISEVPLHVQSKLLRAVQEQEFERVGGSKPLHVDVRIISTSNRNMKEAIEQKLFREDLYYRLNVVPIHLAPLRERAEDILPLAEYFLHRLCVENHKSPKKLSAKAEQKLQGYPWPGNIRELANVIERCVVLHSTAEISERDLFLETPKTLGAPVTLEEVEKRHILDTLTAQNYNRTKTAELLGISVRTLRNKLQQYEARAQ